MKESALLTACCLQSVVTSDECQVLYYYNVATLLLHRRWSLDRRSFSSSTPLALESRVDISKAHWDQNRFEVEFEFLCAG